MKRVSWRQIIDCLIPFDGFPGFEFESETSIKTNSITEKIKEIR